MTAVIAGQHHPDCASSCRFEAPESAPTVGTDEQEESSPIVHEAWNKRHEELKGYGSDLISVQLLEPEGRPLVLTAAFIFPCCCRR